MRRKSLPFKVSKRQFKKRTGIQRMNTLNPRTMRGGIRL